MRMCAGTQQPKARRLGSVGQAVKGAELAIVGPDGQPCPEGEEGEIWAAGPMVFQVRVDLLLLLLFIIIYFIY